MSECFKLDIAAKRVIELGVNGLISLDIHEVEQLHKKVTEDHNKLRQVCYGKIKRDLFDYLDAACKFAKLLIVTYMKEYRMMETELSEKQEVQAELIAYIERLRPMLVNMDVKESVEAATEEDVIDLVGLGSKLAKLKAQADPYLARLIEETYGTLLSKARELLGEICISKPGVLYGYLISSLTAKGAAGRDLERKKAPTLKTALEEASSASASLVQRKDDFITMNSQPYGEMSKYFNNRSAEEVSDWEVIEVAKRHYGYITEAWLLYDLKLKSRSDASKILDRITKKRGIFRRRDPLAREVYGLFSGEKVYVIDSVREALTPIQKTILQELEKGEKTITELLNVIPNCTLDQLEHILKQMKSVIYEDTFTGKYRLRFTEISI